jgi:ABC-type antimicrobial peptide transport system permease subunit
VSIFLIISTIVIYKQLEFAQSRKIGYDSECLIEIPARGDMQDKFGVTKAELLQIPSVKSVAAGTDDLIQFGSNTSGLGWPGKTDEQNFLVTVTSISHDWTKTAGVKVVEGRDFSPEYGGDTLCCMLNQAAVKQMGLASPVLGTQIRQDTNYTVIGVIEDFSYNDPLSATMPMILFLNTRTHYNYFVRFQNDENWQKSLSQVEAAVKKVNPNYPFEFHFTKEEYQKNFDEIRSTGQLANMFGGIAILISCLGLFGLSAFVAEQRKKEISIRKVLGATVANIWLFLSRDFLGPVLIAFVLAAPIASWLMQKLLSRFEYHIELSWWMFALAGLAALLIAIFTVSYQGIKAALVNPVKALKSE